MLYYINFVHGGFMAQADGQQRLNSYKQYPNVLWWFRWGAMLTFLSGWALSWNEPCEFSFFLRCNHIVWRNLGSIMWANVWFVIWPAQKINLAVAAGKCRPSNLGCKTCPVGCGLRTNVLFSIPLLFFMELHHIWEFKFLNGKSWPSLPV